MAIALCANVKSELEKLELETALHIYEELNTPRSLMLWLLVRANQLVDVIECTCNPIDYDCPERFRKDYLASSVLKKSPNLAVYSDDDRETEAYITFFEGEQQCLATNQRFSKLDYGSIKSPIVEIVEVSSIVNQILGELSDDDANTIIKDSRFGPGAVFQFDKLGLMGRHFGRSLKYWTHNTTYQSCYPFHRSIIGDNWSNKDHAIIIRGNRTSKVKKNARTDRTIAIEASAPVRLQLGIGARIKSRLKRFGWNLSDGAEHNRKLVALAHQRKLATLDVKNASGTMAYMVPLVLLNPRWFHLLEIPRAQYTRLPKKQAGDKEKNRWHYLQQFSSMGNGYTFELESLIFLAITLSCVPAEEWLDVGVFGDDIICPQAYAQKVATRLDFFGFSVNQSKSFLGGEFFESCGQDFFRGIPVRPFFLRKPEDSAPIPYALQIANSIRLYAKQCRTDGDCSSELLRVWKALVRKIPRSWRVRVPESIGDFGIISSIHEVDNVARACDTWLKVRSASAFGQGYAHVKCHGWEGYFIDIISVTPVFQTKYNWAFLMSKLDNKPQTPWYLKDSSLERVLDENFSDLSTGNREVKRGLFGKPRTKSVHVMWPDGLKWIP